MEASSALHTLSEDTPSVNIGFPHNASIATLDACDLNRYDARVILL